MSREAYTAYILVHIHVLIMALHHHDITSSQVEVELTKDPTLGMGITGGRDGENAIQSGDTVSWVLCQGLFAAGVAMTPRLCHC